MLVWKRTDLDVLTEEGYLSLPERTICQSHAWQAFLSETQGSESVVATLMSGTETVGYFSGAIVRKYGARILGSPFPGWTTSYMGFSLAPGISRRDALKELVPFCFDEMRCIHMELMDRHIAEGDIADLGFAYRKYTDFEIELTRTEDELYGAMKSPCRRCIRKAEKTGVVIEQATDSGFADEYYAQMEEVFAKQSLVPTYGVERVRALIRHLLPTDNLLLLRARDPNGRCIATGIFPGSQQFMYFWGGASWREHQHLRPNEAIQWEAMRYWKERGAVAYNMGGAGEYKRKYGCREITVPWLRKSKYGALEYLRGAAKQAVKALQRIRGWVKQANPQC